MSLKVHRLFCCQKERGIFEEYLLKKNEYRACISEVVKPSKERRDIH